MATWYHKGRTPVSVDTIDRGSVVIVPRVRFQAHEHAVAHLVKAGVIVRVADAVVQAPAPVPEPELAVEVMPPVLFEQPAEREVSPPLEEPRPEQQEEPEASEGTGSVSDGDSDVVGSATQVEAEAERADGDPAAPEKKQSRSSKRGRR